MKTRGTTRTLATAMGNNSQETRLFRLLHQRVVNMESSGLSMKMIMLECGKIMLRLGHYGVEGRDLTAQYGRILAPSFSETSLRKQEPLLTVYVDLLLQRLRENARGPIDIWQWIKLATFDITGDLTFGESFDCLETSTQHVSWRFGIPGSETAHLQCLGMGHYHVHVCQGNL